MVFKQIQKAVSSTLNRNKESFGEEKNKVDWLSLLIALLIIIAIQLVVGKYLWNNYLVTYVPAIRPVESVIDILAISLLYRIMFS